MNLLFVLQVSQSTPYRRAKSDIWLAIPPEFENACGMEINMKSRAKNLDEIKIDLDYFEKLFEIFVLFTGKWRHLK